jgi:hypothetical protein
MTDAETDPSLDDTPDPAHDIFGKIDALRGRRGGLAPARGVAPLDDFPVLTEIFSAKSRPPSAEPAPGTAPPPAERPFPAPDPEFSPKDLPDLGIVPPSPGLGWVEQLPPDPLELRLGELIGHQQAQLETLIRRVLREELERYLGPR